MGGKIIVYQCLLVCSLGKVAIEPTQISCSASPPPCPALAHPPKQICESSRPYQESKVGAAANPCNTRRIILTTCSVVFFHPFVFPVNDLGETFQRRPLVVLNEEPGSKDNRAPFDFFSPKLICALRCSTSGSAREGTGTRWLHPSRGRRFFDVFYLNKEQSRKVILFPL